MPEYSESDVTKLLDEQKEKLDKENETALRIVEIDGKLNTISAAVTNTDNKVCYYLGQAESDRLKVMEKIGEVGTERRHAEELLHAKIDAQNEYNHATFVQKIHLRTYVIIIIAAVSMTTAFTAWIGMHSENKLDSDSIERIVKRFKEAG